MTSKKVLLISYYFPPLGGAGISRPLSLFKHLPEHGIDCHVLTVKPVLYRMYEPELIDDLDKSKIYRSGSRDPSRIMYLFGFRKISAGAADQGQKVSGRFFPDSKAGWINPAANLAKTLTDLNNYDSIISTSPSVSAHAVALNLSESTSIQWLADFQDFWVIKKAEDHFASEEHKKKAKEFLKQIRNRANVIVANNQSVAEYVAADQVIPNSFESELMPLWTEPTNRQKFVIGVFGTIGEQNPIEPLLKILTLLKEKNPKLYESTRVLQVGQADENWLKSQVLKHGHGHLFDLKGYLGRKSAVQVLSESNMFYLGVAPEIGCGIIPIRLYTLLSSGRPIIAFTESGSEIDKTITPSGNGFSFNYNSMDRAYNFVTELGLNWLKNGAIPKRTQEQDLQFSSKVMVSKFADLLKSIS